MVRNEMLVLFIGMGLVTYLPRMLPLVILSGRKLPQWLIDWLDLIPAAILSALLAPALITGGEPRVLEIRPELIVSIPVFILAWKTKSLVGTVLAGMALFWLIGKVT
jgi:branched-subunit amino acid transport protein